MQPFPDSTIFGRVITKTKFYDKMSVSPSVKRAFTSQVEGVVWRNKFSAKTLNVQAGKRVIEINVFELALKNSPPVIASFAPSTTVCRTTFSSCYSLTDCGRPPSTTRKPASGHHADGQGVLPHPLATAGAHPPAHFGYDDGRDVR